MHYIESVPRLMTTLFESNGYLFKIFKFHDNASRQEASKDHLVVHLYRQLTVIFLFKTAVL